MFDYFKDLKKILQIELRIYYQSGSEFIICVFLRKLCCVVCLRPVKSVLRLFIQVNVSVIIGRLSQVSDRKVV